MKQKLAVLLFLFELNFASFGQSFNGLKLDSFFTALSVNNKCMGSFVINKNGINIYNKSIGFANNDSSLATNETLYRIGSVTKMYTATMIFQLIDENKITLNSKLSNFYPQMPNASKITIEILLSHRSGLYDYTNDQKDLSWITKKQSTETILSQIEKGRTHFLPNKKFSYCNSGYFLLAKIIEKITKETYNQNLQKRICDKIGLVKTFAPFNNVLNVNEAEPFSFEKNKWEKITDIYFPNAVGVGDILATPTDLAKFVEALLGGKLVSKASLFSMKTFKDASFGMGIMKVPFYKRIGYGHGGDTFGTHTIVSNFPQDSITIASAINGDNFDPNEISIALLSIYFNKEYTIPTFKSSIISKDSLAKYIGVYSSKEIPLKITITEKTGMLFGQATGQSAFPLEAAEKDIFTFLEYGIKIIFSPNKKEFILEQSGGKYKFTKK